MACMAIDGSEVGIGSSGPKPANVSFADRVLLSAPSPCDRRYRLRVVWADLTPCESSAALLSVELAYPLRSSIRRPARLGSGLPGSGFPPVWAQLPYALRTLRTAVSNRVSARKYAGPPKFLTLLYTHATL